MKAVTGPHLPSFLLADRVRLDAEEGHPVGTLKEATVPREGARCRRGSTVKTEGVLNAGAPVYVGGRTFEPKT